MAIYHSNHKKLECKEGFNSFLQYSKDNYSKVHTLKVDRIITLSSLGLLGLTISSSVILSSSVVSADDTSTVDEVNITVPASCTMSGTGMQSHNAEIVNGTYTPDIGSTTLHAFCNDNEGFAIYAAGYTGNEIGAENSNKLVGTTASNNATIESGIATTAGNPDVSNWAMKLAITQDSGDTTGTNAFTIDSAPNVALPSQAESGATEAPFSNYHVVPNEYTKVAHKNSTTDMTATTGGVKLTTTYAAYISKTQAADAYSGQVIYTLVHPSSAAAPVSVGKIGVIYNANGSTFAGGGTTNNVVYANECDTAQIAYRLSKSSNVNDGGTRDPSATIQFEHDTIQIPGATSLKVEIKYGMEEGTGNVWVMEGPFPEAGPPQGTYTLSGTGENTYTFSGDMVTIVINEFGNTPSSPNYGYYAKVYPLDANGNEYVIEETDCVVDVDSGVYASTTDWYGSWYGDIDGEHYDFMNEAEVTSFLSENTSTLSSTTIDLYRSLTFDEAYAKANKTQTGGYYSQQDLNKSICQTVAIGQNSTVKDVRDNNTYMIGRLKDGNCWMLDNLALDPTDSTTAQNMNESNTNATAAAINNLLNGGSSTTGWSNTAVANVTTDFNNDDGYIQPRINNDSKNTLVTSYGPASTNGQAKVGIYYNFCAASASTYCYARESGVDKPGTLIDADQDICPANWRMPTGGYSGEYYALAQKYGSGATNTNSLQYNLSTPLSGNYNGGWAFNHGGNGSWWSSTYNNSYTMYLLNVYPTRLNPSDDYGRLGGLSMRCVMPE